MPAPPCARTTPCARVPDSVTDSVTATHPHRPAGRRHHPFSPRVSHLAVLMAALANSTVWAETHPYYLGASQSLSHESNIYRIGDQQVLPGGYSKADTVATTALFAGLDQSFGRQRVSGNVTLRANHYQHNRQLNNQGYGLSAAWDWATVERLSGSLSASANRNLTQFNEGNNSTLVRTERNLESLEQMDAKLHLGVVTRFTGEASLGLVRRHFSAASYARSTYNQQSGSLGFSYRPGGALTLGAALRLTGVDYPNFQLLTDGSYQPDRLHRQDIDFTAYWQPSGASAISARLSPTRNRYDGNTRADFSGLTGSLIWAWQPGGRTKLTTTLSHDTGQSYDAVSLGISGPGTVDYSRTTTALKLKGEYDLTGKIALTASITQANRALSNTYAVTTGATLQTLDGSDRSTSLALGSRWQPTRSLQLGCDLGLEHRSSSNLQLSVPMGSTSFSCFGQFTLQ